MSGNQDFVIENGVLKKYKGRGWDVSIPEGVTGISQYAFRDCTSGVVRQGERHPL